ncbi:MULTISPECIES: hypothetical protein [unclassified Coleofasciculus]|uniref:hypothetical protein n=1 Tax=Cyanophyceae TaxID=3028117 RepID=UPI001688FB69|nr:MULTISPECIES: hypothetical protein [unclassified Coleofasciculus]MBD2087382.1 hypothetical protein [Coleofasciculus sp. FACHB-542]MBD2742730.1 hypothetical protein [Coleofasciculus sp. FACHB-1120]
MTNQLLECLNLIRAGIDRQSFIIHDYLELCQVSDRSFSKKYEKYPTEGRCLIVELSSTHQHGE